MKEFPNITVVVLNWNGADHTIECVEALLTQNCPDFEVVICDNDSRQEDVDRLAAWVNIGRQRVTLIHTGGNLGFAGGVNVGVRHALEHQNADYVWILNNDTSVSPDALIELVRRVKGRPEIGICGSSLIYHHNRKMIQALGGAKYVPWRARSIAIGAFSSFNNIPDDPSDVENRTAYVVGAAMFVSRAFCEKVGLMDESYFLYSEEHDWAYRGIRQGFKLAYAPKSHVYHKHGATIGTSSSGGSALSLFYLYRNKLIFSYRYYPALLPISVPFLIWDGCKFAIKGHTDKAMAVWKGLMAAPKLKRFQG